MSYAKRTLHNEFEKAISRKKAFTKKKKKGHKQFLSNNSILATNSFLYWIIFQFELSLCILSQRTKYNIN